MAACMAVRLGGIAQMRTIVASSFHIPDRSQLMATATAHSPALSPTLTPVRTYSHTPGLRSDTVHKLACTKFIRPITSVDSEAHVGYQEADGQDPSEQVWMLV